MKHWLSVQIDAQGIFLGFLGGLAIAAGSHYLDFFPPTAILNRAALTHAAPVRPAPSEQLIDVGCDAPKDVLRKEAPCRIGLYATSATFNKAAKAAAKSAAKNTDSAPPNSSRMSTYLL